MPKLEPVPSKKAGPAVVTVEEVEAATTGIHDCLRALHAALTDPHAAAVTDSFAAMEALEACVTETLFDGDTVAAPDAVVDAVASALFGTDAPLATGGQAEGRAPPPSLLRYISGSFSPEAIAGGTVPTKAVQHGLQLLATFVGRVRRDVHIAHATAARKQAMECFIILHRVAGHQTVQAAALALVQALVEAKALPTPQSADCRGVLDVVLRAAVASSVGQTVKARMLRLAGCLSLAFPVDVAPISGRLLKLFVQNLEAQARLPEPETTAAEGLLLGFSDFLANFATTVDEGGAELLAKLYAFVKATLHMVTDSMAPALDAAAMAANGGPGNSGDPTPSALSGSGTPAAEAATGAAAVAALSPGVTRYAMVHAALQLLRYHASLLKEFLTEDALDAVTCVATLCRHKNVELHKKAYPGAAAVVQAVAFELCTSTRRHPHANQKTLVQLLSKVKGLLHSGGRYEVSFALSSLGLLARPIAKFASRADLSALLDEMAYHFELLFGRGHEEVEEATKHLSQYIHAFACLLLELGPDDVTPQHVEAVHSVLHTTLLLFPKQFNFPKLRLATPGVVLRLLLACTRLPALHDVLPTFVQRAVLLTISSSSVFSAANIAVAVPDGTEQGGASTQSPPGSQGPVLMSQPGDGTAALHPTPFATQGGAQVGVEDPAALAPDAVPHEAALFEEFDILWRGILAEPSPDVFEHWGFPWLLTEGLSATAVKHVVSALRAAVLQAAMDTLQPLDLSCRVVVASGPPALDALATFAASAAASQVPQPQGVTAAERAGVPVYAAHQSTLATAAAAAAGADNAATALAPTTPKDYSLFLNLVAAFERLVATSLAASNVDAWGAFLIQQLVEKATAAPHASGVYSMLAAVLRAATDVGFFSEAAAKALPAADRGVRRAQRKLAVDVLQRFLADTLRGIGDFRDELLASALTCILAFPVGVPRPRQMVAPLRSALRMGSEYEPLAVRALEVLTLWLHERQREAEAVLLPALASLLARYVEHAQDSSAVQRHLIGVVARSGSVIGDALRSDEAGQGQDGDDDDDDEEGPLSSSVGQPLLRLWLPYRDTTVAFSFDTILPRVLRLARQAQDRKTRTAACELLHSLVVWVVGSSAQRSGDDASSSVDYSPALQRMLPTVLRLAVSSDAVPRQLFGSLVQQLVRWFAQAPGAEAGAVLDAVCEGLGAPADAALRTLCARCLADFQAASIRSAGSAAATTTGTAGQPGQASLAPAATASVGAAGAMENARHLYRRLFSMCSHPSVWKRLGAAVALNQLYVEFREVDALVSEHVLDVLYYAFNALAGCDSAVSAAQPSSPESASAADLSDDSAAAAAAAAMGQLKQVLGHMEKVIVFRAALLVDPPQGAATRAGSRFASLQEAVEWLLEQSGCVETEARHVAMRLFATLCSCLPGFDTDDGPMRWLAAHRQTHGVGFFAGMFAAFSVTDPERVEGAAAEGTVMSLGKYAVWAREIEAALECHDWLLSARFLPPHVAFGRRGQHAPGIGPRGGDAGERALKKQRHDPSGLGGLGDLGGIPVDIDDDEPAMLVRDTHGGKRGRGEETQAPPTVAAEEGAHLPQSHLLKHAFYFLRHMAGDDRSVARLRNTGIDSQNVWLQIGASQPTQPSQPDAAADSTDSGVYGALSAEAAALVAQRRLGVLEALVPLLESLLGAHPTACWLPSDPEVRQQTAHPVLHPALYDVAAVLLLQPRRVLGPLATDPALAARGAAVAGRLCKVLWRTVSRSPVFHSERPAVVAALERALPWSPSDAAQVAHALQVNVVDAVATIRGLRALYAEGALLDVENARRSIARAPGSKSSAAAHRAGLTLPLLAQELLRVVQLLVAGPDAAATGPSEMQRQTDLLGGPSSTAGLGGGPVAASMGQLLPIARSASSAALLDARASRAGPEASAAVAAATQPLAQQCLRDLAALALSMPLPVDAFVSALVDAAPAHGFADQDADASLAALSAASATFFADDGRHSAGLVRRTTALSELSAAAVLPTGTRGARLLRLLPKEIEAFAARNSAAVLRALLPARRMNRALVFECALLLCGRFARAPGPSPELEEFLREWAVFCRPADGEADDFELVDLRLAAAQLLLAADPGATLRHCRTILEDDVALCLGAGLVATATSAAPSQATSAAGTPATPGTPHRHGAPGGLAREAPLFAQGTPPPPARAYQPFSRHCLLKAKRGVRLLRTACAVAPWLFGTVQQRRRAALNAAQRRDAAAAQAQQDQHWQYMQAEYGVGGLTPAPGRTAPSTPYAKSDPSSHRSTDHGGPAATPACRSAVLPDAVPLYVEEAVEDTPFAHRLVAAVEAIVNDELPVTTAELREDSTESDAFSDVTASVLDLVGGAPVPALLFAVLPLSRHRALAGRFHKQIAQCVQGMRPAALAAACRRAVATQQMPLPRDIRLAVTQRVLLPALQAMPPLVCEGFFADEVRALTAAVADAATLLPDVAAVTNNDACAARACAFALLEAMYRLCSTEALKGSINHRFTGTTEAAGKELTEKVIRGCVAVRSMPTPAGAATSASVPGHAVPTSAGPDGVSVDAAAVLQLRQAAHSCLVSVVIATQRAEKLFVQFLLRERTTGPAQGDLWHQVTDLAATHSFDVETNFPRRRDALRELRASWDDAVVGGDGSERSVTAEGEIADGAADDDATSRKARRTVARMKYLASCYLADSHLDGGSPQHAAAITASLHGTAGVAAAAPVTVHSVGSATPTPQTALSPGAGDKRQGAALTSIAAHKQSLLQSLHADLARSGRARTPAVPKAGAAPAMDTASQDSAHGLHAGLHAVPQSQLGVVGGSQWGAGAGLVSEGAAAPGGTVEVDSVWRSCCTAAVLRLVDHLTALFPPPNYAQLAAYCPGLKVAPAPSSGVGPGLWPRELVKVLCDETGAHANVRLLVLRVVTLRPHLFAPYANELFCPVVRLTLDPKLGRGVHYVARDVIHTFLLWHMMATTPPPQTQPLAPGAPAPAAVPGLGQLPPLSQEGDVAAAHVMSFLVRNASHHARHILRENLELTRCVVEQWRHRAVVSKADLLGWLAYDSRQTSARAARMCGVQLCGVVVANSLPLYNVRTDATTVSEDNFYRRLAANMERQAKDLACAAAEVCGRALAVMAALSTPVEDRAAVLRGVVSHRLQSVLHMDTPERFVLLLHKAATHHAPVVDEFLPAKLLGLWSRVPATEQGLILEMLAMRAEHHAEAMYRAVTAQLFSASARFTPLQVVGLCTLLRAVAPYLEARDDAAHLVRSWLVILAPGPSSTAGAAESKADAGLPSLLLDARMAYYSLCIYLYDTFGPAAAAPNPPPAPSGPQSATGKGLLTGEQRTSLGQRIAAGFGDEALVVRDLVLRFWDNEARLPCGGVDRFHAVFTTFGGSQLGPQWLQCAAILLLYATHRSPDFARPDALFPHPLTQCQYHQAEINTSGRAAHSLPLTPMFATQAHIPVSQLPSLPASLGGDAGTARAAARRDPAHAAAAGSALTWIASQQQPGRTSPQPGHGVAQVLSQRLRFFQATQHQGQSQDAGAAPQATFAPYGGSLTLATAAATPTSSLLWVQQTGMPSPGEPGAASQGAGSGLRRRFRKVQEGHKVRRHILHASALRRQKTLHEQRLRDEQHSRVSVFRTYRVGEVPDVQLALQAFVVPLQALCLYDHQTAATALSTLSDAFFAKTAALCGATPGGTGSNSATVPVPGLSVSAGAPASFTMFAEVQPQLAPQQVAVVRSDIFAALRRDLKAATSPSVVRFVHERLLDDAAATDPADVFASAAASGAFPTAVLLLEAIFEAVERRLADATRRAQQRGDSGSGNGSVTTVSGGAALAVAAASAVEAAGLRQQRATTLALLYSAWKHCPGGDDQALLTAARYMPDPAAFKTVVAELRRGNLDAATKAAAAYIAAAERPVAPTGDDDPIARQRALVLSTARFEHRQALLQGLQFDDVSDAFSALAQQQDEADALWAPGHAHELSQLIVSRSRSTRPAARQALLAQLDQSGAAATLERPLLLFEERRFAAACRACDSGLSDALRRWVAVPGAAADPAALGALQNLLTLRDAASTLSNRRLDAARFAAQAVRALGDWGAAAPLDDLGTPDPRQWHDTLWVRGTVADAYAERLDALRDDAAPAPLLELWAGSYPTLPPCPKVGALAGDIARHAGAVASHRLAAAAGAASLGAPRRAVAAKRFLQTATTMTEAIAPGHAFDMGVWRSVVLSTMQRACDVLELSGDALRKTFGDIQSHVKAKAAKLGLETGIARDRVAYALLQCEFWAALSRRLVASEGAACEQEVVPMINKSYKKFAVAVAASGGAPGSAVSSQADPDAAASGEGSLIPAATSLAVAQYCTDMVAFLARNEDPAAAAMATPTGTQEGAGAHQALRSSLATAATTQLLASLEHHGSDDARRMFPRLLPLLHESQDARDALAQRAPLISTWLVLPWIGQLVSALLGAVPVAATVAPLLSRVAAHYPQVAFYPYNCIREELEAHVVALTKDPRYNRNIAHSQDSQLYTQHVGAIASAIATLRAIAQDDLTGKLRLFCSSLHKLHHPELRLRAWWDDIKAELARFRDATRAHDGAAAQAAAAKAQQLWRECWKDCFDHTAPGIGSYNRKFARSYAAKAKQKFCDPSTAQGSGSGALSMDYDRFRRTATLLEEARQGLQFKDKMGLAAFSEALAGVQLTAHSAAAVELPQQPFTFLATMGPVPMPTVAAVDHTLLVMGSVQKPKRLTVTTSDVRRHMLLVKGGDDVRLDQRLEQLFSCVNAAVAESLREDAGTRPLAPVLRIRTYSVIPVDKKVGLVEWVDGTEPMKRTIERSMHNDSEAPGRDPTVEAHPATKAYHDFVGRVDGGNKEMTLYQRYLAMFRLVRNRAGEHTARVGEWKGLVKGAYLRDGLTAMAPDRAGWYDVRQRFTHTTAALSAAGYVLGVGDRHLQNCLIDKRTGDAIPIDFGHAFGSATMLLGIPELMPFRMTPQMVLALGPLGADAVAPSMVRTLQAVRRKKSLLLGIMNAFLSEPLVAWEKEAAAAHSGGHQLTVTGLARRRLDTVQRKIDMVHPVTIMSEEVAANAHVERAKLREFVTAVLQGEPVKREGAQQLTGVEQQVQLLLEMATDDNILGRTWVGWSPLF